MQTSIGTSHAFRDNKAWGEQLREWRRSVAISQARFVDSISQLIGRLSPEEEKTLRDCNLLYRDGLTPGMLGRYEVGQKVPETRGRHLLLLWGLIKSGCSLSVSSANRWLEWGGQGLLTSAEMALIFNGVTPLFGLPVTAVREALLDDLLQQLLQILRRLNARESWE